MSDEYMRHILEAFATPVGEEKEWFASQYSRMLDEFHSALGEKPGRGGAELRATLHTEEHAELLDELTDDWGEGLDSYDVNREALAKELADVVYIAFGTAYAFNLDLDRAIELVHENNMAKIRNGTFREDGKLVKSKDHPKPDLSECVR